MQTKQCKQNKKQTNYLPSKIGFTLEEIQSPFPECSSLDLFGSLLVFFSSSSEAEDAEEATHLGALFFWQRKKFLVASDKAFVTYVFLGTFQN